MPGLFAFEDCPLKHHVRLNGWLPRCRNRKKQINDGVKPKYHRRLRYFTFCAVGAIDVLMLDVEKVIRPSQRQLFDTVYFFDKDPLDVVETQKRIPGATGFVGDFVDTVLLGGYGGATGVPLSAVREEPDTAETRERQRRDEEQRRFIEAFPFDVINLDLEEFLFKPKQPPPGRVMNALRQVFQWQQRPLVSPRGVPHGVDGFSLMFTTQIGPPNLSREYMNMLRDGITVNLREDAGLQSILEQRAGEGDISVLQQSRFDLFFKLATPKVLANALMENDWYVDPQFGILIYEFERASRDGPYKILHLVTDVKRHSPPKEHRAPGVKSGIAEQAYRSVVRQLFSQQEMLIDESNIDRPKVQQSLENIKARRKKLCPEE